MDARLQRRGRGRPRPDLRPRAPSGRRRPVSSSPRRWSSACSARAPRCSTASPAPALEGDALRAALRLHRRRGLRRRAATPCCSATSSPPRTAPASSTRRSPSARTTSASGQQYGLAVVNPVRADGTYDERIGPYAGRCVKDADPDLVEDLRERGRLLRAEDVRARLPALLALRHAAALLRQAVLVHRAPSAARPPAGRQRDGHLAPRAHQARALRQLAGEQRRLGALARALLGHAAAGVALRATRRTRTASARFAELEERSGVALADPHRPYVDDVTFPCPECGSGDARVPEVIDVWFDSGAMPFAQYHAPFENAGALRGALPRRLHLRGARPDARLVLLAAGRLDPAVRPRALRERRLPRPDPRRRGPEDVEVQGQHRRALGGDRPPRRRRVPLVLLHLQAAVGRLPLLARHGRRVRAPVPAAALEHLRLLRPLRRTRPGAASPAGDEPAAGAGRRPRPLDPLAAGRDERRGHRAPGRLRRDLRRPRDRRLRRRPLQLVRAPLAAALLGRRRRRLRDAAPRAWSRWRSCSRRSRRSSPTRSTTTSTGASRACT